ncbi:sigma-70 family RNA polymerase sigma factor [Ilumatobacter sp.]|uniref:sigma-70 family RNA polymerase sigma factor n=1 Tax=Ilumatobacter sp. TaxID=1967498 RepID=UPI003753B84E
MNDITRVLFAAQDGDPTAFERFVQLTIDDVTRFCHYLGDRDHVEDLVQDTYLRALRGLHTFRGDNTAKSWLLTIARRSCADSINSQQRARRTELTRRHHTNHTTLVDTELLLDELPDDQRYAFVLTQLLGYRYGEAAAISDCAVGTIRSRVSRARAHLAHLITQAEQAG